MPYAEAEELGILMGRGDEGLDGAETARAEILLELATGVIDAKTEQSLQLAETTHVMDGHGTSRLILPRWPVTAIASVIELDDRDEPVVLVHRVDYRWSRHGILRRIRGCWPCKEQAVTVTLTAGHDPIPDSVRTMCLRIARAGWDNPLGLKAERLGDWSAQYVVPGMELTTAEIGTLAGYRAHT